MNTVGPEAKAGRLNYQRYYYTFEDGDPDIYEPKHAAVVPWNDPRQLHLEWEMQRWVR